MGVAKLTKTLYLDFETQSRLSLRNVGVYRYAEDFSTQVMCAGWAFVDHLAKPFSAFHPQEAAETPEMWIREQALPAGLDLTFAAVGSHRNEFIRLAADPEVRLVAHNAEFERQLLREKFYVDVPLKRISCTAARAARMSLPRNLEGACVALGLDEEKDADGHRVLMKLTRPRRPSKEDLAEFWTEPRKPEDYARVYDYCAQDVRAMIGLDLNLPELEPLERAIWELTVEMNERGVKVDLESVRAATLLAEREDAFTANEFQELFGVKIGNASACAKALGLPDAQKATVRDALKAAHLLDPKIKRGLELRQKHARSSVKKLQAFAARAQKDGRLRGSLTYSGAERTQRWSGSGVQPQNFPRGLGKKTDEAFEALQAGVLQFCYEDVLKIISAMLRGFIKGPLLVGDFSQVEARVLAWLAGEEVLLQLFRDGGDPYCDLASEVYGRKITKADEKERFMGKQAVLGSGYQIGPEKFWKMLDELHDVQIDLFFARRVVWTYRNRYSRIVGFWQRMERAFFHAVSRNSDRIRASREGLPPIFMGCRTIHGRPFAYIELPSGRKLWYAYAQTHLSVAEGYRVRYLGRSHHTHQWGWTSTYGGKLTENIVQALSRDLLAEAMLRLKERGFPLQLTVHDEVVAEPFISFSDDGDSMQSELEVFDAELKTLPPWASGLPLTAESFRCERYRK